MAKDRNITWNVTVKADPKVAQKFKLQIDKYPYLDYGMWEIPLPSEIIIPEGKDQVTVSFKACGRSYSMTGTQGTFSYISDDATKFNGSFDIPYYSSNSGYFSGGSDSYTVTGDTNVPRHGNSITMNITITQVN